MKEIAPLHINIPKPCSQNSDTMTIVGTGKQCAQCNTVIHDFSQMNDDELLNFFRHQPTTHCGRFHQSQLSRDILPTVPVRKLLLSKFNKIAAAFFTILSFKAFASQANFKSVRHSTVFDSNFINKSIGGSGKVVISGTIKDSEGKPLAKAIVTFDTAQVAITNAEGKFTFEIDEVSAANHNLYFSYDGLIPVVRTYHPAMLSTAYDVTLQKPGETFHIMGIMVPPWQGIGELPSLAFKKNITVLNAEQKIMLSAVAAQMKAFPDAAIVLHAYPPVHESQRIYTRRLDGIMSYLVLQEGLSADRIFIDIEIGGGDKTIIDIKAKEEDN